MHDKNGKPLAKGDTVMVECVIRETYQTEPGEGPGSAGGYCNISCETVEPMWPSKNKTTVTLNAKQVVKVEVA